MWLRIGEVLNCSQILDIDIEHRVGAEALREFVDRILIGSGTLIWIISGFWGLGLSYGIVQSTFGSVVAILSILVAPLLVVIAPFYELAANGSWFPLGVIWGGGLSGLAIMSIGSALSNGDAGARG